MAGYSGTPLAKKLGIKNGSRLCVSGAPDHLAELLCPLPQGASISPRLTGKTDLIHIFAKRKNKLETALRKSLKTMKPDAVIWVSWPKKAARVNTDVTEDVIRDVALPLGLVDIKVCAVDETWSGLKFMLRKVNRAAKSTR